MWLHFIKFRLAKGRRVASRQTKFSNGSLLSSAAKIRILKFR